MADFDRIVSEERLARWLEFMPPTGTSANKVCVWSGGGAGWFTATTDERAGVMEPSPRHFSNEGDALQNALDNLRYLSDL